jgi:hypothetical protein
MWALVPSACLQLAPHSFRVAKGSLVQILLNSRDNNLISKRESTSIIVRMEDFALAIVFKAQVGKIHALQ